MRKKLPPKNLKLSEIDQWFDIQVDAKAHPIVMVFANVKGRKIVDDLWPDVQWSADEKFSSVHSADWLFTHIRVTRLPPYVEATSPLKFADPSSLAFAVACELHRRAWPLRVAHWVGDGENVKVNAFEGPFRNEIADTTLFAEYVPPTGRRSWLA